MKMLELLIKANSVLLAKTSMNQKVLLTSPFKFILALIVAFELRNINGKPTLLVHCLY